jgi:hypothetical protein
VSSPLFCSHLSSPQMIRTFSTIQLLLFTSLRILSGLYKSRGFLLWHVPRFPTHPSQSTLFLLCTVVQHKMPSHPIPIEKLKRASNCSCSIRSNEERITAFFITIISVINTALNGKNFQSSLVHRPPSS